MWHGTCSSALSSVGGRTWGGGRDLSNTPATTAEYIILHIVNHRTRHNIPTTQVLPPTELVCAQQNYHATHQSSSGLYIDTTLSLHNIIIDILNLFTIIVVNSYNVILPRSMDRGSTDREGVVGVVGVVVVVHVSSEDEVGV